MDIPFPFPPCPAEYAPPAPQARPAPPVRPVRFPARPRWRFKLRRAHARLYLMPRRYFVALALAPLACLALVMALRALW